MSERMQVVLHGDLGRSDLDRLRAFFDHEYLTEYGAWTPDAPYGYSPADTHVLAYRGAEIVGHAGSQRRRVAVADRIHTVERCVSRLDGSATVSIGDPVLILPVARAVSEWPVGVVDLRGTPW